MPSSEQSNQSSMAMTPVSQLLPREDYRPASADRGKAA
jgi:hypothetical protein